LKTNSDITAKIDKSELEEFFILSDLTIDQGQETVASVKKTSFGKCARCWRHREYVGKSKTHPELCDRCESVVAMSEK
jgi:isoleucyl-tRNA synthetase